MLSLSSRNILKKDIKLFCFLTKYPLFTLRYFLKSPLQKGITKGYQDIPSFKLKIQNIVDKLNIPIQVMKNTFDRM